VTAPASPRPGGRLPAPPDAALPIAIALAVAPLAVVLQSKAAAPIAVLALAASVLAHRRAHGAWPWPRGLAAPMALLVFAWAALSALWAIEPRRALATAVQLGGFVALGAAAAQAVAAAGVAARERLLRWTSLGLLLGLATAAVDAATGHAVRGTVRGLAEFPPSLAYGLKPAASAMALWLPLAFAAPLPALLRAGLLGGGAAVLLALPGETPKLAVLAAALTAALAWRLPRPTPRLLGAGLAMAIVLMPALLGPVLARGIPAAGWPPSAAHRLLVWDFTIGRIAERPLTGWGMEASRSVPGHRDPPSPALLARFGLDAPGVAAWIPGSQLLPLHPHNGALQLWLELGLPGAVLGGAAVLLLGALARRSRRPGVACAMLASAGVTAMLSFGLWQEWWVGAQLLALCAAAALPGRSPAARPGASAGA
jgi:O-antigen ligase